MIWTYDMDLTVSKLVYLNCPEILVESIRDKTKNYHTVLEEFNKKFKLHVKQARTVRARFERLLLDYKKRSSEGYSNSRRESELDLVLKGIVKLERQFYSTYEAKRGEDIEKIHHLKIHHNGGESIEDLDFDRNVEKLKSRIDLRQNSPILQEISSNDLRETNKSTNDQNAQDTQDQSEKVHFPEESVHNFTKHQENVITDIQPNMNSTTMSPQETEPHNALFNEEPPVKKYKKSLQPNSQPFHITNYFSDNKTMIMNGDGVQNVNGTRDIVDLIEKGQQNFETLKQDLGQLSNLSKQIAHTLKKATSNPENSDSEDPF